MADDTTDQGVAGVGMFIAAYTDQSAADNTLKALKESKDVGEFYYDDAAVIRRDAAGEVSINETGDMTAGKGAGIGALIGGVIGLLGGPAGVVLGAGAGAAIGGVAAHSDAGFNNDTLERIGGALPNDTSALAVTTSKDFIEAVRDANTDQDTMTLAQQIADGISGSLEAGQDTLVALLLTEEGVAATKVVSSDEGVAVFGIAATEGGVVGGGVVATDEGAAAGGFVATDEGVVAGGTAAAAADDDTSTDDTADDTGSDSEDT